MDQNENSWADPSANLPELPLAEEMATEAAPSQPAAKPRSWGAFAGVTLAGLLVGGLGATVAQANQSEPKPAEIGDQQVDVKGADSQGLPTAGLEDAEFHHGPGSHEGDFDDDGPGDFDDDHEDFDDD